MPLYEVNASFGDYSYGEYVTVDEPALVSDWIEAQFLSLVDDDGTRTVEAAAPPG